MDWVALAAAANRFLVTAALAPALERKNLLTLLPTDLQDYLHLVRAANAQRNAAIRRQLCEIIDDLNAAGIVPLLLKGSVALFEPDVHGGEDPGAGRIMSDVDLLVPPDAFPRAAGLLIGAGYELINELEGKESHAQIFARAGALVTVDLHRSLGLQHSFLSVDAAWKRAEPLALDGQQALTLCPTHRIAFLIFHRQIQSQGHALGEVPLRDLHDYAVECRRFGDRIDWPEIARMFGRFGWSGILRDWVDLADRLMGLPPPPGVPAPHRAGLHRWRCVLQERSPALMAAVRFGMSCVYPFTAVQIAYFYNRDLRGLHPLALAACRLRRAAALLWKYRWKALHRTRQLYQAQR
ncbi:nucleotidyltransferase family protein [Azospirillum sp.]|uniref:nucleotidyltransferase family protein n=1 Tax=Azospirillum sp. TaxID=34012 RepID=UPI003D73AC5D